MADAHKQGYDVEQYCPDFVHLCAPAVTEAHASDAMKRGIARKAARLYFTPRDMVLATAFRGMERDDAIGWKGVEESYPKLVQKDVSKYFDVGVHNEFESKFSSFFEEHET
eukprot:CAMPEP_0114495252 /NCGR_PEP_ID=MMETSP0109-20121206/5105_1 /TAXON_ID=29199 /ORGANISM="Chlorarachnion reptans, Strain CCCM449" /LENGTH=110 /DNA_ID=CAMNT_0001672381 /DNA_START=258 /DNA_END=590 /DNA_ORIENTATION=+